MLADAGFLRDRRCSTQVKGLEIETNQPPTLGRVASVIHYGCGSIQALSGLQGLWLEWLGKIPAHWEVKHCEARSALLSTETLPLPEQTVMFRCTAQMEPLVRMNG